MNYPFSITNVKWNNVVHLWRCDRAEDTDYKGTYLSVEDKEEEVTGKWKTGEEGKQNETNKLKKICSKDPKLVFVFYILYFRFSTVFLCHIPSYIL